MPCEGDPASNVSAVGRCWCAQGHIGQPPSEPPVGGRTADGNSPHTTVRTMPWLRSRENRSSTSVTSRSLAWAGSVTTTRLAGALPTASSVTAAANSRERLPTRSTVESSALVTLTRTWTASDRDSMAHCYSSKRDTSRKPRIDSALPIQNGDWGWKGCGEVSHIHDLVPQQRHELCLAAVASLRRRAGCGCNGMGFEYERGWSELGRVCPGLALLLLNWTTIAPVAADATPGSTREGLASRPRTLDRVRRRGYSDGHATRESGYRQSRGPENG